MLLQEAEVTFCISTDAHTPMDTHQSTGQTCLCLCLCAPSQSSCLSLHCSTQKAGILTPTPQVYVDK